MSTRSNQLRVLQNCLYAVSFSTSSVHYWEPEVLNSSTIILTLSTPWSSKFSFHVFGSYVIVGLHIGDCYVCLANYFPLSLWNIFLSVIIFFIRRTLFYLNMIQYSHSSFLMVSKMPCLSLYLLNLFIFIFISRFLLAYRQPIYKFKILFDNMFV